MLYLLKIVMVLVAKTQAPMRAFLPESDYLSDPEIEADLVGAPSVDSVARMDD